MIRGDGYTLVTGIIQLTLRITLAIDFASQRITVSIASIQNGITFAMYIELVFHRFQIRKQNNYDKEGNSQYRLIQ